MREAVGALCRRNAAVRVSLMAYRPVQLLLLAALYALGQEGTKGITLPRKHNGILSLSLDLAEAIRDALVATRSCPAVAEAAAMLALQCRRNGGSDDLSSSGGVRSSWGSNQSWSAAHKGDAIQLPSFQWHDNWHAQPQHDTAHELAADNDKRSATPKLSSGSDIDDTQRQLLAALRHRGRQ